MSDKPINIMFVDDDVVTCRVMQRHCDSVKYACQVFQDASKCLSTFSEQRADIIITDLRMPKMNGFDFLSEIRKLDADVPMLVMTGYSSVENAVEAMKRGASDFIKKPFDFAELRLLIDKTLENQKLRQENKKLKETMEGDWNQFGMIGKSPIMATLYKTIEKVAEVNCNVIISGETGTGKELVGRALHEYSPRKAAPFVAVDCGALTTSLLESELFGYEKGAFTGATQRKTGLLEQAMGGTLFLDEICNISDAMQIKLMRALEENCITRVGGSSTIPIDVRIVAASNRDLEHMVEKGELREDFYHRLNVVNLRVPRLSERSGDIPELIHKFVDEFNLRYNRQVEGFDSDSMQRLCKTDWPGNVRELRNTVERCIILADGAVLNWDGVDEDEVILELANNQAVTFSTDEFYSLTRLEQEYINHVLKCFKGKKTKVAEVLGIDKTTLWRKLRRYDDENPDPSM